MQRLIVGMAFIAAAHLVAGSAIAEDSREVSERDVVSSVQIREGGGYRVEVAGLGQILISDLVNELRPGQPCFLVVPALTRELSDMRMEQGVRVTVELQARSTVNDAGDSVFFCEGGGTGCKATVELLR